MNQKSTRAQVRQILVKKIESTYTESTLPITFQIKHGNQAHITYNRPKIMNAFNSQMYLIFIDHILKANQMEQVKYIVIRGAGGNFCSGNDLNNFTNPDFQDFQTKNLARVTASTLKEVVQVIVNSNKPIFALVQGRCVGFAFTQLALYDKVFATDDAYFTAPLVKIAQGPQMGSAYTFPKIFGQALAQQIIIKTKQMSSTQLQKYNFLTSHHSSKSAMQHLQAHINQLQKLDWPSYIQARKLMRKFDREQILKINVLQCQNLVQRWSNPQLPMLMMRYLADRKKQVKPKL